MDVHTYILYNLYIPQTYIYVFTRYMYLYHSDTNAHVYTHTHTHAQHRPLWFSHELKLSHADQAETALSPLTAGLFGLDHIKTILNGTLKHSDCAYMLVLCMFHLMYMYMCLIASYCNVGDASVLLVNPH